MTSITMFSPKEYDVCLAVWLLQCLHSFVFAVFVSCSVMTSTTMFAPVEFDVFVSCGVMTSITMFSPKEYDVCLAVWLLLCLHSFVFAVFVSCSVMTSTTMFAPVEFDVFVSRGVMTSITMFSPKEYDVCLAVWLLLCFHSFVFAVFVSCSVTRIVFTPSEYVFVSCIGTASVCSLSLCLMLLCLAMWLSHCVHFQWICLCVLQCECRIMFTRNEYDVTLSQWIWCVCVLQWDYHVVFTPNEYDVFVSCSVTITLCSLPLCLMSLCLAVWLSHCVQSQWICHCVLQCDYHIVFNPNVSDVIVSCNVTIALCSVPMNMMSLCLAVRLPQCGHNRLHAHRVRGHRLLGRGCHWEVWGGEHWGDYAIPPPPHMLFVCVFLTRPVSQGESVALTRHLQSGT